MAVWIIVLLAWLAISVVAALVLGAVIRLRERKEAPTDSDERSGDEHQPRHGTGA